MRARTSILLASLALVAATAPARADTTSSGDLVLTSIGTFTIPVYATSAPGDPSRLFVVEEPGTIKVVRDGAVLADPFLSVPNVHYDGEQGLLSMAFAPDYAASGRFYVYYNNSTECDSTGHNCDIRVDEFRRGADADHADPATQRQVLRITHQADDTHNGGQLQFGPDGFLWLAPGDGGGAGDPDGNAQNDGSMLGKLIRVDPSPGGSVQVWAKGLRNPWRFSFDALTGDLYIADVGQNRREEVDMRPAGSPAGANFGWNVCEGDLAYPSGDPCPANPVPDYVAPIFTYATHVNGTCAITGGYVVRDPRLPQLAGRYVYGDYCQGTLQSFSPASPASTAAPLGDAGSPLSVSFQPSFGQDGQGCIYAVSRNGPVYRLDPAAGASPGDCSTAASTTVVGGGGTSAAGPTPPPLVDRTPPRVSFLGMLHRRFAVSSQPTAILAAVRPARGTAFRFTLSERARVAIRIDRLLPGRRVGRLCLAATRARRFRPRCTRLLLRGTLWRTRRAGRTSTPFTGRIGRRALAPGRYRATVRATDAAGNVSRRHWVDFTVLAG